MKEGMTERNGFTIVELLTVMGVIAVLIGLLVPALNLVKDHAKQVQQQAQFHSIEAALEMFSADFGTYPESSDNYDGYMGVATNAYDNAPYGGANKLAEALIGLDYLGFHPNSDFRSTGESTISDPSGAVANDVLVYNAIGGVPALNQTADENIKSRKGPYIEFENANAYRMNEVYEAGNLGNFVPNFPVDGVNEYPLVLCDVFAKKRSGLGNKKTGMPILYYRARTNYTEQDYENAPTGTLPGGLLDDIYYYGDNYNLLELGSPEDPAVLHPIADGIGVDEEDFEQLIINKKVRGIQRPYRAGSYILMSAGKDGLYGNGDDVFNFNKEVQ